MGEYETWQERIERKVDSITLLLTGNGNPERGVIVRLLWIERLVRVVTFVLGALCIALISALVTGKIQLVFR